eukprot:TRINITY_DN1830_c0_g1_i18.p3 TRINITY_DN1830_c0_g1~~TRINITY_DN1830_c0_g1_i18.p3  ORF type:complete len:101 (-),score=3.95 TRINITY_DN1830_c0_g1_i18:168-449(-)
MALSSIEICSLVASVLSVLGASAVIVMCFVCKSVKMLYWRVVIYISISDLGVCASVVRAKGGGQNTGLTETFLQSCGDWNRTGPRSSAMCRAS